MGGGSAIYSWLLFQYLLLDTIFFFPSIDLINFVLRVKGCSRVSLSNENVVDQHFHLPRNTPKEQDCFDKLTKLIEKTQKLFLDNVARSK